MINQYILRNAERFFIVFETKYAHDSELIKSYIWHKEFYQDLSLHCNSTIYIDCMEAHYNYYLYM